MECTSNALLYTLHLYVNDMCIIFHGTATSLHCNMRVQHPLLNQYHGCAVGALDTLENAAETTAN